MTEFFRSFPIFAAILLAAGGCSKTPPDPAVREVFEARAITQQQGPVTARAAVLADDESERYFGVSLADKGMQAVWLSVKNDIDGPLYYLPATTDANYYTPPEASRIFHAWWPGEADRQRGSFFARQAMPEIIGAGQVASGIVLTHREGGVKFVRAAFVGAGEQFEFRFVIQLDRKLYAAQNIDFNALPKATENVDLAGLRRKLEELPCCTSNKEEDRHGDPLNLVIVGSGADAIFPFIERGWRLDEPLDVHSILRTVGAFVFGTEYTTSPVSPLYVFGRPQDIALQKARNSISLRNHLRVWHAPFTFEGHDVWVGQISRDIGTKLTTQTWSFTTHRISPEVDQDRYYILQDLLLTGEAYRFAFAGGVGVSSPINPRTNLGFDPYVTDGLRLVIFLGPQRKPAGQVEFIDWERPSPR
ncbi:LssY C-terminal domain-containing protein [Bradyrhizobium jicamae]|uniref:LssY C-terminal domain-containing protein n=1 Tax=Bradyrhizobium jicamae TaxID=280332 RepID=A0ABS5FKH2_9BRAD|nr:LssY C-terminal domain-containing protein [Bradyrhizobium jicamae]MBR0797261.1 LssY C-terminal domain-containing protein [Bradyrhizobium jicamae]